MAITPRQNLADWQAVRRGLPAGARAGAEAMARYLAERAAHDTLQRASHAPGDYFKAAPGAPPASASGNLAASMYFTRGTGGLRAEAYVGNSALYAGLHEFGCHPVEPTHFKVMHWVDSEGSWYHARLPADGSDMPEHPFLGPTADEAADDGSLTDAAMDAFREYDP